MEFMGFNEGLDINFSSDTQTLLGNLDKAIADHSDPREVFQAFTRALQEAYDINRGMLALNDGQQIRFLAVATWNNGKIRKNLSLRLSSASSLFERVAQDGRMYTENITEFFDGNLLERNLLLNEDTKSFLLKPIKHADKVVALLGYSSDNPHAFVTLEEGLLDPVLIRFGELIAKHQSR